MYSKIYNTTYKTIYNTVYKTIYNTEYNTAYITVYNTMSSAVYNTEYNTVDWWCNKPAVSIPRMIGLMIVNENSYKFTDSLMK